METASGPLRTLQGKRSAAKMCAKYWNIDEYAARLQAFLLDENAEYSPGVLDKRREGTKNKEREICKPLFFPDLCAQWAAMQVAYPGIKRGFYQYSCASIPGRGTHYAKRSVERYFRRSSKNTKYCGQFDVKSFFASINKQKNGGLHRPQV